MNAAELTEFAELAAGLSAQRAEVLPTFQIDGIAPSARLFIGETRHITVDLDVDDEHQVRAVLTIVSDNVTTATPALIVETPWKLSRIIRAYVTEG